MKPSGKLLAAILALVLGTLTLTGCGGLGQDKGLLLAKSENREVVRPWIEAARSAR